MHRGEALGQSVANYLLWLITAASANAPTIVPWPAYPPGQVRVSTYQIPYIVIFSSRQGSRWDSLCQRRTFRVPIAS
jgi:hypothetical protein